MSNILEVDHTNMIFVKGSPFLFSENHEVTLSDYYIGQFPVTGKLWKIVMDGDILSNFSKDRYNYPVVNISWKDIKENFLPKLNKKIIESSSESMIFRLPSEAEWEYSARGGKYSVKDLGYVGNNLDNNVINNLHIDSKPVGQNSKNKLGIQDIFENVWEWCEDAWQEDLTKIPKNGLPWKDIKAQYRVFRGGPNFTPRNYCEPMLHNFLLGFRLVCTK